MVFEESVNCSIKDSNNKNALKELIKHIDEIFCDEIETE